MRLATVNIIITLFYFWAKLCKYYPYSGCRDGCAGKKGNVRRTSNSLLSKAMRYPATCTFRCAIIYLFSSLRLDPIRSLDSTGSLSIDSLVWATNASLSTGPVGFYCLCSPGGLESSSCMQVPPPEEGNECKYSFISLQTYHLSITWLSQL